MRCGTLVLAMLGIAMAAQAGTLDRVRAEGVLHCGGIPRPGLLLPGPDGSWQGLEVEICRAVGVAVLGEQARIAMHAYPVPPSNEAMRTREDSVSFLSASDILAARLLAEVVPGRAVFIATDGVMVPDGSPAQHVADLAGQPICGEPGTGPQRALVAWFAARGLPLAFFPFQETDEMLDAYDAGRCGAMAGETTRLAAFALQARRKGHASRLLPDTIAASPIMANTGRADAGWSAVVAWTVDTLLAADATLPLDGATLGLAPGWQAGVIKAVGHYDDIHRRTLGADSPWRLPLGLNARWNEGGLMCPPYSE